MSSLTNALNEYRDILQSKQPERIHNWVEKQTSLLGIHTVVNIILGRITKDDDENTSECRQDTQTCRQL